MYEKLKRKMTEKNIAGNALAIKARMAPSDFYNAIKGNRPFYPQWRKRIAEALEVKESDIFDD